MKTTQVVLKPNANPETDLKKLEDIQPNLVLIFGSDEEFSPTGLAAKACKRFPKALVVGCSTAGEISNGGVSDKTLVVTGSHFDQPNFRPAKATIESMDDSTEAGKKFASSLEKEGLKTIFILGRGLNINGSALIEGIRSVVGKEVVITGGLAGDGGKFKETFTLLNGEISNNAIVGFGVYGDNIEVAFGSMGGWEPFGPVRKVTKAVQNVLYELDGEPALEIYKKYLGPKAKELPASGLLYPFALLKNNQDSTGIIRTILAVNEEDQSVTLAGDIPVDGFVRLMHASNENLINGAKSAAETAVKSVASWKTEPDALGILISCVGRKLVMGDDIEEELDVVKNVFGSSVITGFYSYGEICPQGGFAECKLHNQTMTITYLKEKK